MHKAYTSSENRKVDLERKDWGLGVCVCVGGGGAVYERDQRIDKRWYRMILKRVVKTVVGLRRSVIVGFIRATLVLSVTHNGEALDLRRFYDNVSYMISIRSGFD